jgi:hypothetical protein
MKMDKKRAFNTITPDEFNNILAQYPSIIPDKLADLDRERYKTIPGRLEADADAPSLSKDEVATLVEWKLTHGKFRPTLRALVQQNAEDTVTNTTRDAFKAYANRKKDAHNANIALTALAKLRGIGPATASLLLSVYDPENAPFFSDELFRWGMLEDSQGWYREIKYNAKEYLELYERVNRFRERFRKESGTDVPAVNVEKVAYVLGKQATAGGSENKASSAGTKRKTTSSGIEPSTKPKQAKKVLQQSETEVTTTNGVSLSVGSAPSKQPTRRSGRTKK